MMPDTVFVQEMPDFASGIISWQKVHGRHDLPWQNTRDPYAIWISEIMLQQTQVSAVISYYQRFMQRFPDIATLAAASQEHVLQCWSGLGYYSRARHLHAAAQQIMRIHAGQFPQDLDAIQALPGIGRSTAAAIAAFSFGQRQAILDGNVKRVLARFFGIEGWPGQPAVEKQLWQLAEQMLPEHDIEAYTQGLMDLGATLCARRPVCGNCPVQQGCVALRDAKAHMLPSPKPRRPVSQRHTTMLLLMSGNEVLLEKRPSSGIWGGLWSLPETNGDLDMQEEVQRRFKVQAEPLAVLPPLVHAFTHYTLTITPQPMRVRQRLLQAMKPGLLWLDIEDAGGAALPAPVKKLLTQLKATKPAA